MNMDNLDKNNKYIIYDLETNGLDYYTTGIMQITILDMNGDILLNQYVYPFNDKIDGTAIHGIDLKKLNDNNAISTIKLCSLIKDIIQYKYGDKNNIYWIAYNNFGYDQLILENNYKICNIKMPTNWYFIDIYPLVRDLYKIVPNYKLKTVYEYFFGKTEDLNFHCSLTDTKCLYKVYCHVINNLKKTKTEYLLNRYTRSLLGSSLIFNCPISTLNGYSDSIFFDSKKIYNIGDLFQVFQNIKYNTKEMDDMLKCLYNIYSDYNRINLIKQLNFIKYLHKL